MFQHLIAHGRDMIRRLEAESRLAPLDREALPPHRRVPKMEATEWEKAIIQKLQAEFDDGVYDRYQVIRDLFSDEVRRGEGDADSQALNRLHRVVALLADLDDPERGGAHVVARAALPGTTPASSYDVFISHASEDKEAIARPLYTALVARGVSVWFDEMELQIGDGLRRGIERGLSCCRFGIVVLSPHFLEKEWPQRELDALLARETSSGETAIIPIWHNLDHATLSARAPLLLDRLAARSEEGIPALVEKIARRLKRTDA
jgi:hypothetical protein